MTQRTGIRKTFDVPTDSLGLSCQRLAKKGPGNGTAFYHPSAVHIVTLVSPIREGGIVTTLRLRKSIINHESEARLRSHAEYLG